MVAIVAIAILLNSPRFHVYLIRTAEAKASESLGVKVQLQNFTLHLMTLSADLYGVTVDGANPYPNPPLLQVDHVEAGVRVVSIPHRAWYLDSLRIDRPVIHVLVDANGASNLPRFRSNEESSSQVSVFDIGIRHALVDRGEIYWNDEPSALAADLRDLELKSSFNALFQRYSGRLVYTNGRLEYGQLRPVGHNLEVQFDATPTTLDITDSKVTFGDSQIALFATLRNYSQPEVQGHFDITVNGRQMADMLHNPSIPVGMVHTSGSLSTAAYESLPT